MNSGFIIATLTVLLIGTTALASSSSASAVPLTFGVAAPINTDLATLGSPGILSGNVMLPDFETLSGNTFQAPFNIQINAPAPMPGAIIIVSSTFPNATPGDYGFVKCSRCN